MGQLKRSDYKANMKAIFRRKLPKCQNKTILKLRNISNRFSMRQRILLSDRFIDEATGDLFWFLGVFQRPSAVGMGEISLF